MPRLRKKSKNHAIFLKTVNSLRSNRTVFLTEKNLIFLTAFSLGGGNLRADSISNNDIQSMKKSSFKLPQILTTHN
jgi:hypothetical protein